MGSDTLVQTRTAPRQRCTATPVEVEKALAKPEYWDQHYANATSNAPTHEWFKGFSELKDLLHETFGQPAGNSPLILHLGSGDSTIPANLHAHNYRRQVCVDFSATVVLLMAARHAPLEGITWHQADVREIPEAVAADKTVDVAFDKGTLDAMIHGSPWNPPEEVRESAGRYLGEVHRVLKDEGVFLWVSFRQPHFMKPLLGASGLWDVAVHILGGSGSFDYYGYVMTKKGCR